METKAIIKKIEKYKKDLENKLEILSREENDKIIFCESALMEVDEIIRKVKAIVSYHQFEDMAQEIYFFKNQKPYFISKFIYYSKVLEIESNKHNLGGKSIKKYYEKELNQLKKFYFENADFYNYYRRNATYMDHQYFVRNRFDLKNKIQLEMHNYDEKFTTSCDIIVSYILAYSQLEKYLLTSIENLKNVENNNLSKSNISWTAQKVSLIELIYALYQAKCFNGGNIELSEIIRHTEKALNIDLSGFHKTVGEIKSRKNGRTKFLQLLNDNLNQFFLDSDA